MAGEISSSTTTVLSIPSLVELCYQSIAEHLEYNSDAIKVLPIDLTERLIAYMVDRLHPRHLIVTQTRAIKIRLIKQKRSCTFRFLLHGTVRHAIQQIYEKTEDGSIGVQQYGLFQPAGAFRRARWLQEDKSFSYYDIDTNDVLDFKTKETTIKIKFLGPWEKVVHPLHLSNIDKTVKTFVVDESKTVGDIAKDIATKLGLPNLDELSLKQQQEEDDVGVWLVPDQTLPEQGVDPLYTTFLLKRLFYFSPDNEKVSTSVDGDRLHYIFCQCLDAVVAMSHPCETPDQAVLFAALQCQIGFGDYMPQNLTLDTFKLKDYLPVEFVGHKGIEREVVNTYQRLVGLTEEKAKFGYIQLTKSLKTYLYTFFRVVKFVAKNQTRNCLLGISADTVLVIDAVTRETIERHPFTLIRKWQVLHSYFSLFLQGHQEEYLTVEAETVSKVLFTHIHYALREVPVLQKRFGANYDSVSRSYSRRRVSTDLDLLSHADLDKDDFDPNVYRRRCPLYVEPKKIYVNLMYRLGEGPLANLGQGKLGAGEEIVRIHQFVRIFRLLSELSHKMIRSISKGGVNGGKEREIQVKFSDKKVKSFLVNEKRTVREISHEIGRKLGIKNTDEFSLQLPANLQAPSSPTSPTANNPFANNNNGNNNNNYNNNNNNFYTTVLSPQEDESFPYDGPLWLNPNKTLAELDIPETAILFYKKKFYYHDGSEDCTNDPVYYNLLFYQSRDAIISNVYTCTTQEAVQLAATLFQINFGDHNPNIHKPGFLKPQDLRFFLPQECLEAWGLTFQKVEKMIYKEHRTLRGIKEVYAKFRYVQLCRSLKTFGAIFFHVRAIKERPHPMLPTQSLLLGFSRKCILVLTSKTKKFLSEIPLSHLRRWAYNQVTNIFSLDFGDYEEGCISFHTTDGEAVSQYLADYIDFIQTKLVGSQALMAGAD